MKKIRINYKDGRHKTFKSSMHTAESIQKEVNHALEKGRDYLLVSGIKIYPDLVREVKEIQK